MDLEERIRDALRTRAGSARPDEERGWDALSRRMVTGQTRRQPMLVGAALLVGVSVVVAISLKSGSHLRAPQDNPSVSCPETAFFDGRTYEGQNALVYPVPGEVIGQARLPDCRDSNDSGVPPDQFRDVARLPGVDPSTAVVDALIPQVIYIRSGVDPLSTELRRFFVAPTCVEGNSPITLDGTWLTIGQPDGGTELDLIPPYDLGILVADATSPRYLRAKLLVRVPASLGTPLTYKDVTSSLWKGGTLRAKVTCHGTQFVATSIQAFPP